MRPARHEGPAMRLLSWNVASLRSLLTKVDSWLYSLDKPVHTENHLSIIVDYLLRRGFSLLSLQPILKCNCTS